MTKENIYLDRIYKVFNKEQSSQFSHSCIEVLHDKFHYFLCFRVIKLNVPLKVFPAKQSLVISEYTIGQCQMITNAICLAGNCSNIPPPIHTFICPAGNNSSIYPLSSGGCKQLSLYLLQDKVGNFTKYKVTFIRMDYEKVF